VTIHTVLVNDSAISGGFLLLETLLDNMEQCIPVVSLQQLILSNPLHINCSVDMICLLFLNTVDLAVGTAFGLKKIHSSGFCGDLA